MYFDPALGNGGLGRLAACFLDSLATLGYSAYGCGIRYRYGMFKQQIRDGYQIEVPDNWLENGNPFELRRPEYAKEVKFGGYVNVYVDENGRNNFRQEGYQSVTAIPYDLPIVGYGNGIVNTLRIWDAQPVECFKLESFDKGDYQKAVEQENLARNIVEVLYPNDNHYAGKELRLKQQYFFISASVQDTVYGITCCDRKMRHLYLSVINNRHLTHFFVIARICLFDPHYKTAVDFFYNLINSRKQPGEQLNRPFFQSFRHNRMVRIRTCLRRHFPCLVPCQIMLIH